MQRYIDIDIKIYRLYYINPLSFLSGRNQVMLPSFHKLLISLIADMYPGSGRMWIQTHLLLFKPSVISINLFLLKKVFGNIYFLPLKM